MTPVKVSGGSASGPSAPRLARKMVSSIGFYNASGSARRNRQGTLVEIYHDLL